jgi:succinate-acetate transporter protein
LLTLGLVFVNARGLQNPQIFLNIGLPLGGIAVMTASMFSFAEGNTFLVRPASYAIQSGTTDIKSQRGLDC